MTPEERADAAITQIKAWPDGTTALWKDIIEILACAIRDAENEAIERAALAVRPPCPDGIFFRTNVVEAQQRIRALKTEGPAPQAGDVE